VRHLKPVLLLAGILLLGALVYTVGATPILETIGRLTWWQFLVICAPYALIMAADTLGWRYAFARDRTSYRRLYGARLAGEALNVVTAVGSVGGEAVKAWLLRRDVGYEESVPAVVIAKTTIVMAQAAFLLIGIAVAAIALPVDSAVLTGMLWLLVVEVVAVGGFFAAQVSGLIGRMGALLARFGVVAAPGYAMPLDDALRGYYRRSWPRFTLSVAYHLLGWLLGAVEALIMLWALDVPASMLTALVIEALGSGVRFATFLVPASLGAFEGANAAAFGALGFGAATGLAFSLVRRARQIVWIVIGLIVLIAMRWTDTQSDATARRAAA
jgi:uncharacterized membrane protein YbhN (UPF0104 family)